MRNDMTIIDLRVTNHPGVMSHITGLFARRAFNLEGILCGPEEGGTSRMFLLVKKDERLPQIEKQLRKLYDVRSVVERSDCDTSVFYALDTAL